MRGKRYVAFVCNRDMHPKRLVIVEAFATYAECPIDQGESNFAYFGASGDVLLQEHRDEHPV